MNVYCNTCGRFIAEARMPFLDAREIQRLHKSQTGHVVVVQEDR